MKIGHILSFVLLVCLLLSCTSETDYCRAYCQRAGECEQCGGLIDIDGCVQECKDLDLDTQKKLVDCYKGECENIFICDQIIGTMRPSPCY